MDMDDQVTQLNKSKQSSCQLNLIPVNNIIWSLDKGSIGRVQNLAANSDLEVLAHDELTYHKSCFTEDNKFSSVYFSFTTTGHSSNVILDM